MRSVQCIVALVMMAGCIDCQQERRESACGLADNLTVPLTCDPGQWISVFSEMYSTPPAQSQPCSVGMTCISSVSSHNSGLDVSCNGPVGEGGVCQEETEARRWLQGCQQGSEEAAVEVRYKCVDGSDVMDMCSNETRTWAPPFQDMELTLSAYLVTPAFPNTPAVSQQCTCSITGEDLWMQGLEIMADVGTSEPWLPVVVVEANGTTQWDMTHSGGGTVRFLQESMLVPRQGGAFQEATLTYQDFNLPRQLAYIRVQGIGRGKDDNLTISCQSIPVPPPPSTTTTMTTTTTTTTTTTSTTTSTTTTIPTTTTISTTTTTPSTTESRTSAPGGGGGGVTPVPNSPTPPTPPHSRPASTPTSTSAWQTSRPKPKKEEGGEDTGVIAGLVILVILLIVLAVVLGVLIWRRYLRARKSGQLEEGGGGFGAFIGLQYWFNRERHRNHHHHLDDQTNIPISDFHNLGFTGQQGHEAVAVEGGQGQGQEAFETVSDIDLRPSAAAAGPLTYGVRGQGDGGGDGEGESGKWEREVGEGRVDTGQVSQAAIAAVPPLALALSPASSQQDPGSRSRSEEGQGDGEKRSGGRQLSSKKEKFVAKVLDETLEDIKGQREALTGHTPNPPSPSPQPPTSSSSHTHPHNTTASTLPSPQATPSTTSSTTPSTTSSAMILPPPASRKSSTGRRGRDLGSNHHHRHHHHHHHHHDDTGDNSNDGSTKSSSGSRGHRDGGGGGGGGDGGDVGSVPSWNNDVESAA